MNKTELKNFAVSARRDLLEKVALRAKIFGIDEKSGLTLEDKFGQLAINGETYSNDKKSAFLSLKKQLETKGYEQLIEEVAYTWFNRIIAIRYMEVNEYLPEQVNVLSSITGKVEPDILSEFEMMDLNIDVAEIKDLIRKGEIESAYRRLFTAQCNALNKILPFMFEKIQDYTELLLPDFLLDSESVINSLVSNKILTEYFTEIEIIGWLYQYYNSEPKDKVFANLKKNKKIEKNDIPAATQLFTPKWIVQYMVENSLGRMWIEGHPNDGLKSTWKYYLEEPEQELEVEVQLKIKNAEYKTINPEDIKIIDPCMGSGHILVYAFEVLMQIYESYGYTQRDATKSILQNNLYGLDIDDRAFQLAYFAVMMKARQYNRLILTSEIKPNLFSITESNFITNDIIDFVANGNNKLKFDLESIRNDLHDAKEYGCIIKINSVDFDSLFARVKEINDTFFEDIFIQENQRVVMEQVLPLIKHAQVIEQKYDVVVTNPPYMGSSGMGQKLLNYVKKNYPNSKSDLSTVCMEKTLDICKPTGYMAMINIPVWMFLSSYEKLRKTIIENNTIINMIHFGRGIFGADFGTTAFLINKQRFCNYSASYRRLFEKQGSVDSIEQKERWFHAGKGQHTIQQENFTKIPGNPIAYWVRKAFLNVFESSQSIGTIADAKKGLVTGNDSVYLKLWYEVEKSNISLFSDTYTKWKPLNKGGKFRKWYGNNEYVVNWGIDGSELADHRWEDGRQRSSLRNSSYFFRKGITWTYITSANNCFRYYPEGFAFAGVGPGLFPHEETNITYVLAYCNSIVFTEILKMIGASTISLESGEVESAPIIISSNEKSIIDQLVRNNIQMSRSDWDSKETSWDFIRHPLLTFCSQEDNSKLLKNAYKSWSIYTEVQFRKLKSNEEELNSIFINNYGLQNELTPKVEDKDVTLRKADLNYDMRSLISYFVGCMFGRYSLNVEGLVYAGGDWEDSKYRTFKPNKYGLIHLTDEQYFENDIITRLREFLSLTFSPETVEENMQWIAESLELKRNETAEERLRRYFLDEFFKDHCQVYQKRPIYWLVDSGKEKGLRTLIYMHRYQPDTMATIRFEHLQEIQAKYNNEIAAVDLRIVNPNLSATEKRDLEKRKTTYQKRLEELLEFDKNLAKYANAQISIDLDDGVNVNYEKFDKVLAKIK
jgi:type II restriction/modification system DNA methylase subunit YeeA